MTWEKKQSILAFVVGILSILAFPWVFFGLIKYTEWVEKVLK